MLSGRLEKVAQRVDEKGFGLTVADVSRGGEGRVPTPRRQEKGKKVEEEEEERERLISRVSSTSDKTELSPQDRGVLDALRKDPRYEGARREEGEARRTRVALAQVPPVESVCILRYR